MSPKIKKRSDISEDPLTLSPKPARFWETAVQNQQAHGVIALLICQLKILNANLNLFIYFKDNSRIEVTCGGGGMLMHE